MTPGPWQILIIVVLLVLLFGAGRLPRIMEDVAKGINSFRKGMKDEDESGKDTKKINSTNEDKSKERTRLFSGPLIRYIPRFRFNAAHMP